MSQRRKLDFVRLDDIMPDVERLLAAHSTVGRWSLAQMCRHLSDEFRYSLDGFPTLLLPWVIRRTAGAYIRRRLLRTRRMSEGLKVPAVYLPPPQLDVAAEARALRAAVDRFHATSEPLAEHPLLGRMTQSQWTDFHCIHCAHHLSFAIPKE
jgi:hypothetical protein